MLKAEEEAVALSSKHKHWGCDETTLDSWEQQDDDGDDEFPVT